MKRLVALAVLALVGCAPPSANAMPLSVRWDTFVSHNVEVAPFTVPAELANVLACAGYSTLRPDGIHVIAWDGSRLQCKDDPTFVMKHEEAHAISFYLQLPLDEGQTDCMAQLYMGRPMFGGNRYGECSAADLELAEHLLAAL